MDNFKYITKKDKTKDLFFKIPKALMYEDKYKDVSANAKLLYGMLLDRTSLSIENDWFDELDRAYIVCEIEEVEIFLKCARGTANKAMKELEKINLLKKVRVGRGSANLLYIAHVDTTKETLNTHLQLHKKMFAELKQKRALAEEKRKAKKESELKEFKKFKNCTSIENTDVQDSETPKALETLRSTKNELLEVQNLNPNNTNTNKTDVSMYVCNENPQKEKREDLSFLERYKEFRTPSSYLKKVLPLLELKIEYDLFDKILIDTMEDDKKKKKENYIIGTINKLMIKGITTLDQYLEDLAAYSYDKYTKGKEKEILWDNHFTREEVIDMYNSDKNIVNDALMDSVSVDELARKSVENEEFFKALNPKHQDQVREFLASNKYFIPWWID